MMPNFPRKAATRSIATLALKILIVTLGLLIASTGIVLYMRSGLGVDAFSVFCGGMAHVLGISFGASLQLCLIALVVVIAFMDRSMLGIGTVMHAVLMGFFIDILSGSGLIPASATPVEALAFVVCGVLLTGTGLAVYIKAGLGYGAIDALMFILHAKLRREIRWIKIGLDFVLAATGFLLGGSFGITTIVGVLFTGPVIQFFLRILDALFPPYKEATTVP